VPCGSGVGLLPPFGARTNNCPGTDRFPPCSDKDCSGERHHSSAKRSARYAAQKSQNEAYHAVLSPAGSSGREGMYHPLHDLLRNPLSGSVRDRSPAVVRTDRDDTRLQMMQRLGDWASFSCGVGIGSCVLSLGYRGACIRLFSCISFRFLCRATIRFLCSRSRSWNPTDAASIQRCCCNVLQQC
jgi:hypothetical protein